MKIDKIQSAHLNETLYKGTLDSGLEVYVMPKKNFVKKYVFIAVGYGSFDRMFEMPNGEIIKHPDGIAHFLEHQIFEDKEQNIFKKFEEIGSMINAYTSHFGTVYHCDTVNYTEKAVQYMMKLVTDLGISDASVEKERGIIEQEINMYADDPDWIVTSNLMQAMFNTHPSKFDIAGTAESISQITPEMLWDCYEHFYTPKNMRVLCFGDVDYKDIMRIVDEAQTDDFKNRPETPLRYIGPELPNVAEKEIIHRQEISKEHFDIGYKSVQPIFGDVYAYNAAMRLGLDILAGTGSDLFQAAYEKHYIQRDFDYDVQIEPEVSIATIGNDCEAIEATRELIKEKIEHVMKNGFEPDAFERKKRKMVGKVIASCNSLQTITSNVAYQLTRKRDYFKQIEAYNNLTLEYVNDAFKYFFGNCDDCISLLLKPIESEK